MIQQDPDQVLPRLKLQTPRRESRGHDQAGDRRRHHARSIGTPGQFDVDRRRQARSSPSTRRAASPRRKRSSAPSPAEPRSRAAPPPRARARVCRRPVRRRSSLAPSLSAPPARLLLGRAPPRARPVPIAGGGFSASRPRPRPPRRSPRGDGRVLLDGLPPGDARRRRPSARRLRGARRRRRRYEMQFGSFKPTVTASGPWRVRRAARRRPATARSISSDAAARVLAHIALERARGRATSSPTLDAGRRPGAALLLGLRLRRRAITSPASARSRSTSITAASPCPTWVAGAGRRQERRTTATPAPGSSRARGTRARSPSRSTSRAAATCSRPRPTCRAIFALCSESAARPRASSSISRPRSTSSTARRRPTAIDRATATFGRPRMPPRVAFAPWIDAIFGSANVRAVAKKLRDAAIPASVIWTEDWRGGELLRRQLHARRRSGSVDTTLYPDMTGLSDDLHAEGFDFFVYFNPFVYKSSKAWPETAPNGWLVKHTDGTPTTRSPAPSSPTTGLIDLDNPDAPRLGRAEDARRHRPRRRRLDERLRRVAPHRRQDRRRPLARPPQRLSGRSGRRRRARPSTA